MLHQDVLMADIDVDQWRNAQALVLRSAKAARRLVVIHEGGRVEKFRHTTGAEVVGHVDEVRDPHVLARSLYEANKETVDFVVVMERDAVDTYFARIQDGWDIEADLDVFVQQTYAALDEFPDGIVTYPGKARDTLGLQWRVGASLAEVDAAVRRLVAPGSTVILGAHDGTALWASLVLDFDDAWKIVSITTADPSVVEISGPRDEVLERLVTWQREAGKKVSLALLLDVEGAKELLDAPVKDKGAVLARLVEAGRASTA